MAITELRLSNSAFWDITPRLLFIMIAEHFDITDYKIMRQAHASNGGELIRRAKFYDKEEEPIGYVHPDCF